MRHHREIIPRSFLPLPGPVTRHPVFFFSLPFSFLLFFSLSLLLFFFPLTINTSISPITGCRSISSSILILITLISIALLFFTISPSTTLLLSL